MEEKYKRLLEIARRLAEGLQDVDYTHITPDAEQAVADFEELVEEETPSRWVRSEFCSY